MGFPTSYRPRYSPKLPTSPTKESKSEFVVCVNKTQFKSNKVCYEVCVKTFAGKDVVSNGP